MENQTTEDLQRKILNLNLHKSKVDTWLLTDLLDNWHKIDKKKLQEVLDELG